jgi:uncharacterized YigZ family protein
MLAFSFLTIAAATEGLYKEKGSKFLAFTFPVESEHEVKEKIAAVKKEFYDARHHCYAYVVGADKRTSKAYDDGEPNHSAGDAILGQIRSRGLTNILVIVVRYFGGVKLGVGGLAQAYKAAAEDALAKAIIVEKEVEEKFVINFEYTANAEVMKLVKDFGLTIVNQSYADSCSIEVSVSLKNKDEMLRKIKLLKDLSFPIKLF